MDFILILKLNRFLFEKNENYLIFNINYSIKQRKLSMKFKIIMLFAIANLFFLPLIAEDIIIITDDEIELPKKQSIKDEEVIFPTSEIKRDLSKFKKFNKTEKKNSKEKHKPFYEEFLKEGDGEPQPISLGWDASPIAEVVRFFAGSLKFGFLIDPEVKGAITILIEDAKMNNRELWEMFEQMLWVSGSYCSLEGKIVHIRPFKKMSQERRLLANFNPKSNVEILLLPIRNTSAKDVIEKMKPFLTEGASAVDIERQNSILLVETPANIPKLKGLIKLLDKKNKDSWAQEIFPCVNIPASRITSELLNIMPILGFPITADSAISEPGSIHLTSLDRLQVILASAANNEAIAELKKWVSILDKTDVGEQDRVYIYPVQSGKAEELTEILSGIFNTAGTSVSVKSSSSSTSSSKSSSKNKISSSSKSSGSRSRSSSADIGPANVFEVPVSVVTDSVHNRLIIKTTTRTYAMMKALLERLDIPPTQVLLKIMVSQVTLTDDLKYGVEYGSADTGGIRGGHTNNWGAGYGKISDDKTSLTSGLSGIITSSIINPDDYIRLNASATEGNVKVLSSPEIIVKNHETAKLSDGKKVSVKTGEDTGSGIVNASYEYMETGIILEITPEVTAGGLIQLQVTQEVSDFTEVAAGVNPTITTSEINTILTIKNGETIILGGVINEKNTENISKIPLLGDIPWLGKLFSYTSHDTVRTELVMLITGHVIKNNSKLEESLKQYKAAVALIEEVELKAKSSTKKK